MKQDELQAAQAKIEEQERQIVRLAQDKRVFLENLSHELLTPLESILILSRLLESNATANLTPKQVEFAHVIGSSATDLQNLLKELLALGEKLP